MMAKDIPELKPYLIDLHDEFWNQPDVKILCEGAQGFGLDIDWGDYPFVTSSHCLTSSVLLNAIPHYAIRDVWGVAKAYETYVGTKQFQPPHNKVFAHIQEAGQEFGATTGRVRQCNWISLPFLKKSVQLNGVNRVVINKMDIMREVGNWSLRNNDGKSDFFEYVSTEEAFTNRIEEFLASTGKDIDIFFSDSPHKI